MDACLDAFPQYTVQDVCEMGMRGVRGMKAGMKARQRMDAAARTVTLASDRAAAGRLTVEQQAEQRDAVLEEFL